MNPNRANISEASSFYGYNVPELNLYNWKVLTSRAMLKPPFRPAMFEPQGYRSGQGLTRMDVVTQMHGTWTEMEYQGNHNDRKVLDDKRMTGVLYLPWKQNHNLILAGDP
ncbi:hypothetical protein O181_121351 [Austropuccinia psidii MF-1]|uniref:Uncharacterized protein n=1 Tax=Austropuccinia psidii MF-1 TaxID=1389203 RepID=A0A9Q3KK92_9BASI|nr:hypothetical protein [Austropuccinia psidii MF-1]